MNIDTHDYSFATQKPSPSGASDNTQSWYSAVSRAWGRALDSQAERVVKMSNALAHGDPSIGEVMQVTAEAQLVGVLSSSASTVNNSIGEALQTLGRK
jgi:hypothetical protein